MIEILTQIEISSSAERIWRALMDFPAYPRWNPVIRWIRGSASPGTKLSVLFHPEGRLPVWFRATVTVAAEQSEFRWTGALVSPRIFSGDHYFRVEASGSDRCRLIQGEIFRGPLAPLMYRMLADYNRSGFVAMNEALKSYVEADSVIASAVR